MRLMPDTGIVPALMFHSIGLERHNWLWPILAEPVDSFERKLSLFHSKGVNTVFWGDLYKYMAGAQRLPANSMLLTFDDGYLDNWVFAFPLLKRYGFKATIFVNPEFVDPNPEPRPNLEDVWAGRCQLADLQVPGFLSWEEMRRMEASGLVDIQSHALTHTWYFSGPRIVDFHAPANPHPYPWLFWNARIERKPFYLSEDQTSFLPWGYPVLQHEKALLAHRFYPDPAAVDLFVDYVREQGGASFFRQPEWRQQLLEQARREFGTSELPGTYETLTERRDRLWHELAESKRLLEQQLNKAVDYLCWPGGGSDPQVQQLAREVGYKAWTLGSAVATSKRNAPGAEPSSIKRIGASHRIEIRGRNMGPASPGYQWARLAAHQGSTWSALLVRGYQLMALGRLGGGA